MRVEEKGGGGREGWKERGEERERVLHLIPLPLPYLDPGTACTIYSSLNIALEIFSYQHIVIYLI